jgi:hypothetical protein
MTAYTSFCLKNPARGMPELWCNRGGCLRDNPLTLPILSQHERRRSKGESKDPEEVSFAMLIQGVSTEDERATLRNAEDLDQAEVSSGLRQG